MSETMASRAILMFWNEPKIWILLVQCQYPPNELSVTENVRVGEYYTSTTGIFNREFGFAILTSYATCKNSVPV